MFPNKSTVDMTYKEQFLSSVHLLYSDYCHSSNLHMKSIFVVYLNTLPAVSAHLSPTLKFGHTCIVQDVWVPMLFALRALHVPDKSVFGLCSG